MSDVKIYTVMSDELSPPIHDDSFCTDMVRHSDYAALAAENAALKDYISGKCYIVDPKADLTANADIPAEDFMPKVIATDAFLRDQMAKGVEMLAELQRSFIGKPSKNDAASSYCSREAVAFAEQIRRGVTK